MHASVTHAPRSLAKLTGTGAGRTGVGVCEGLRGDMVNAETMRLVSDVKAKKL